MKHTRALYNNTASDIEIQDLKQTAPDQGSVLWSITVPANSTAVIYMNKEFYNPERQCMGRTLQQITAGSLTARDLDNVDMSADEFNASCNEISKFVNSDWEYFSSTQLIVGLKELLDNYDFTGKTVDRQNTIKNMIDVLTLLDKGWLQDSRDELNSITPDPNPNFLQASRISAIIEVFDSALGV